MTGMVALCADEASLGHPDLIGLAGERLGAQEWLRLFSSGEEARRFLRADRTVEEVWVVSSEDVEPINLAASLKRDRRDRRVCLLAFQGTGSLKSRASAAGIDVTLTRQAFVARYAALKAMRAAREAHGAGARDSSCGAVGSAADAAAASAADLAARGGSDGHSALAVGSAHSKIASADSAALPPSPASAADSAALPAGFASVAPRAEAASVCAPHPARAQSQGFLLPVVSGSGGAGKSTVAALAALLAQGIGHRTLLLDFDLQFGDMREMLGMPDALGIDEALAAPARMAQLAPSGLAPALLAAPRRLEEAETVMRDAPRLLDEMRSRFDVVVANTGAAWAEYHAVLLERCSKALFLVDQRASSLRACRHALDLCARCGIAAGPFVFAANRCAKGAPYTSIDVACALQGSHAIELREGGREVDEVMGAGQPLDLIAAKNDLCTSLENALVDLLPSRPGAAAGPLGPAGAASRLFRKGRRRRKGGAPCLC